MSGNSPNCGQSHTQTPYFQARGHPPPDITIRRDGDSRPMTVGDPRVLLNVAREEEESVLRLVLSQTVSIESHVINDSLTSHLI